MVRVQSYLVGEQHEALKCGLMSKQVSEVMRKQIKILCLRHYKLFCSVVISQNSGQRLASRCLCDSDNDGFASACYETSSLFAIASV